VVVVVVVVVVVGSNVLLCNQYTFEKSIFTPNISDF
jgi:hypothetical protein